MTKKQPDNHRPLAYVLLKKYGLRDALNILKEDVGFDLRHGVNTAAPVSCRRLYPDGQRAEQNRYVASTFGVLKSVFEQASQHVTIADCGFVDLGSGKGKALIAAARYPFRSIRGVDVSERMHRTATRNLKRLDLDERVQLVSGSATEFNFEPHERVVYLFNSFTGSVLQGVLEKLATAKRDAPGLLIYVNPTEQAQVSRLLPLIESVVLQPGSCDVNYHRLP
jgi:SAM-dependent methyltransferase